MNERIRELEKQATETVRCGLNGTFTAERFNRKKFAELIVKECMKINRDILCEDDPDYLDQVYKEHFGVK